ncbi:MAG TPA: TonB-dependent receptor, partial [Chitinophagales bacterium]|nr:TonB-dependent receptor [Chitinophagales bacterium]
GVVNIITAWPTDVDPKTEIETNVGVYDHPKDLRMKWWDSAPPFFGSVNVNHEHTFNHVQLICGGNITYSNSYLQDNNDYRARAFFKTRYLNPKMPGLSLMLGGSFQLERIDQFFVSMDMDSLAFVPKSYSSSAYELFILDPHIWYSNLKGHRYHLDMRYMNIFRKGNGTDPNAVSHGLEVDNQYQYKYHGDMLIVTAGVPLNVGVSRSNLYTGTHINFFTAAYAQAEFNYKALELQAGLRYEVQGVDTTIIKSRPVFRSGINVQASKATWFRASWGQGYRAPSVAEKYLASNFTSGIVIIPNDTLKEETSWSLELGFRQGFLIRKSWKLFFDAAFFWQEYKNYVEYVVGVWDNKNSRGDTLLPRIYEFPSPGSGKVIGPKPFNVDNARTGGYELTLTSDGKIGPVGIKMLAGYTYTYPVNTSDSVKYKVGDYLHDLFKYNFQKLPAKDSDLLVPLSIRHLIHADLELTYWKAYLGTSFSYYGAPARNVPKLFAVGEKFLFSDPYSIEKYIAKHQSGDFVIDIRAGIKINEHFSMGFIVKNLTNHFYELRPGIAEPLRNYTIQFRYKF